MSRRARTRSPRPSAANGSQTQVFFLGEDLRTVGSKWDILPQTLANGLKLAMIIAMTSVGLSLIYGTTGLSNFAHGEMVTFGALDGVAVQPGDRVAPAPVRGRSPSRSPR